MIKFGRAVGKYGCFSNFSKHCLEYDGVVYMNSESAWQAQKTLDLGERMQFANLSPSEGKKLGRRIKLRPDWEDVKYDLMVNVLRAKFSQCEAIKEVLLSTGNEEICENTTGWHDNIWGSCECPKCIGVVGQNLLGKALMQVRDELRKA